jgi:hypothetical protein
MIEYRFKVHSAAVFTLYLYSKALEYLFRVPTEGSVIYKMRKRTCVCLTAINAQTFAVSRMQPCSYLSEAQKIRVHIKTVTKTQRIRRSESVCTQ